VAITGSGPNGVLIVIQQSGYAELVNKLKAKQAELQFESGRAGANRARSG
jgi:hypothetical protein